MRAWAVMVLLWGCSGGKPAAMHVASCTDATQCGDGTEPPTGGNHCATTLACRVWPAAQNRCSWLHNLEHGHLVLAYNCPSGCDPVVTALQDYWQNSPPPRRVLVTPDPLLKSKVAAMVWGHSWAGDAVDTGKIDAVAALQDKDAPEPGLGCAQ